MHYRYGLQMVDLLTSEKIASWDEITGVIERIQELQHHPKPASFEEFRKVANRGVAYITFAIGLDGVSVEIAKYARTLEAQLASDKRSGVHLIAGDFHPQADALMQPHWRRLQIDGINGWDKWAGGVYFRALYRKDLAEGSQQSAELAAQLFGQAQSIAQELGRYLLEKDVDLLIPINVASNPGNLALALAVVFVTEALGLYVLNINHDFYWEAGMPASERPLDEEPGLRDHFFLNRANEIFFFLFQSLHPWNGRRWLQVNINSLQSNRLVEEFGFTPEKVARISTSVSSKMLEDFTPEDVRSARLRMAHILSNGNAVIRPRSLKKHFKELPKWTGKQKPRVIGARKNLLLDLTAEGLIYLLQPTRVVGRKRIERDVALIHTLLSQGPLREQFDADRERRMLLHITGPTPREHGKDLAAILDRYGALIDDLPASIGERVFLAFSVGRGEHPVFREKGFAPLDITDIYRLATTVLFPSETEGRGLPIIESAAVGIPIISSRYSPEEVFDGVIGEHLPEELRVRYIEFPEGGFSRDFLDQVAALLIQPGISRDWRTHNRNAVRLRYSKEALRASFEKLLAQLYQVST
jgi:glycosyltransferase involved in cell wall biosynthesis